MDINDFRSLTTVLGLLCFLGIAGWAYSKSSKQRFDEAANLPFADDDESVPGKGPGAADQRKTI